jgi:hypothetical protein
MAALADALENYSPGGTAIGESIVNFNTRSGDNTKPNDCIKMTTQTPPETNKQLHAQKEKEREKTSYS